MNDLLQSHDFSGRIAVRVQLEKLTKFKNILNHLPDRPLDFFLHLVWYGESGIWQDTQTNIHQKKYTQDGESSPIAADKALGVHCGMDASNAHMCHGQKSRFLGDKLIPPLIGNPYDGYINLIPTIGLMTIPYYMEIMGV